VYIMESPGHEIQDGFWVGVYGAFGFIILSSRIGICG